MPPSTVRRASDAPRYPRRRKPSGDGRRLTLGDNVRRLRKARGWSQVQLSVRLKDAGLTLGQTDLSRLELQNPSGKRPRLVMVEDLFSLALALDCPPLSLLASQDGPILVGKWGERPSRVQAWIVGRQPLDTVGDPNAYRANAGLREGSGMSLGSFLRELADLLDAEDLAGQEEAVLAAQDYLRGVLRAVRRTRLRKGEEG